MNNSIAILTKLTKRLKIQVTSASITEELEKHPDQNTLFALSDVLNFWKVANGAFMIEFNDLQNIPFPFVAHLNRNGGQFILIEKISNEYIYVSDEQRSNYKMPLEHLREAFSGNILVAEADPAAGETDYKVKRRVELMNEFRYPTLISGLILILLLSVFRNNSGEALSWQTTILGLLKTGGLITSILLLIHSIDSNNSITERLCIGEKNNCNAILSSKAAKVTEYLSWSEVGFFYFAGSFLFLLSNISSVASIQNLAYLNLACLPYTFYSIYYQWRIAKQWCVFCTTIQILLWLEFIAFCPSLFSGFQFPGPKELVSLLVSFSLPILAWAFIKPFLMKSMQIKPLQKHLKKFKYSSSLFEKLLKEQKRYDLPDEEDSIILGNVEAENVITIVSNPYCQPCSTAHKLLDQWLAEKDSFKLQIVFATVNNDDIKATVARHLHHLSLTNRHLLKEAVHTWYEHTYKDFESWATAYPVKEKVNIDAKIETQRDWCKQAEIKGTPTIFLNGYQIPQPWQYQDIKYFI